MRWPEFQLASFSSDLDKPENKEAFLFIAIDICNPTNCVVEFSPVTDSPEIHPCAARHCLAKPRVLPISGILPIVVLLCEHLSYYSNNDSDFCVSEATRVCRESMPALQDTSRENGGQVRSKISIWM